MSEDKGIDIFDQLGENDLEEVSTAMPVLAPGLYEFEIKSIERKQARSGSGSYLEIQLSLMNEAVHQNGEDVVNIGFPVYDRISLVAKGKYDPRINLKRFLESMGMGSEPLDKTFQSYIGQIVQAKTKVRVDDTGEYPPQTEIASYIKA